MGATQEQLEFRKRWGEALRSGEYRQCTSTLREKDAEGASRYCCLGVAFHLLRPDAPDECWETEALTPSAYLDVQEAIGADDTAPFWFLNDQYGLNFPQIADAIEAEPALFASESGIAAKPIADRIKEAAAE